MMGAEKKKGFQPKVHAHHNGEQANGNALHKCDIHMAIS